MTMVARVSEPRGGSIETPWRDLLLPSPDVAVGEAMGWGLSRMRSRRRRGWRTFQDSIESREKYVEVSGLNVAWLGCKGFTLGIKKKWKRKKKNMEKWLWGTGGGRLWQRGNVAWWDASQIHRGEARKNAEKRMEWRENEKCVSSLLFTFMNFFLRPFSLTLCSNSWGLSTGVLMRVF